MLLRLGARFQTLRRKNRERTSCGMNEVSGQSIWPRSASRWANAEYRRHEKKTIFAVGVKVEGVLRTSSSGALSDEARPLRAVGTMAARRRRNPPSHTPGLQPAQSTRNRRTIG